MERTWTNRELVEELHRYDPEAVVTFDIRLEWGPPAAGRARFAHPIPEDVEREVEREVAAEEAAYHPGDISTWTPEQTAVVDAGAESDTRQQGASDG